MPSAIIKKTSYTSEQKLQDLLSNTVQEGDCLVWTRCFNTDGYARMAGNVKVHRYVFELTTGEDIQGFVIRHTCDNIRCINPDHLLKGTFGDNGNDKFERGRQPRVVTVEKVFEGNVLLNTTTLLQREIAKILGISTKQVSDIKTGKYCSATGKFSRHG